MNENTNTGLPSEVTNSGNPLVKRHRGRPCNPNKVVKVFVNPVDPSTGKRKRGRPAKVS